MNDKALTLFIPVWGQKHHDLLEQYALPSLMLPGNLPALGVEKIYVDIMGVHHELDHTKRLLAEQCPGLPLEIRQIGYPKMTCDMAEGLIDCMHACYQRQTRMLLCMPDTIIGPGSISNIFNYAKGKPVTVSAAHVRNNEDLFRERFPHWQMWLSNRDFVRNSFAIGALDICDTNEDNCTDQGGIAWTRVADETRLMLHFLPTAYLCWFTESDLNYWKTHVNFGMYDHRWPTLLYQERRLRLVGSTDVFFAIELESAARSGSMRPTPGTRGSESDYGRGHPHMEACGSFLIEIHG